MMGDGRCIIRDGSFVKNEEYDLYGTRAKRFKVINKKIIVPGEDELKINNKFLFFATSIIPSL